MTNTILKAAAGFAVLALTASGCSKPQPLAGVPASSAPDSSASAAQVQPQLTPGTVQTASATSLTIKSPGGPATFLLPPGLTIMIAHPGTLADIKAGGFLGTTNVPDPTGVGQSTEVHIFPPGVKMGEGDRPMGPPGGAAGASRMTNGTVSTAAPAAQRMTNGSAGSVSSGPAGVQMDVAYAGGTRHIVVPPGTPVMVMSSGTTDLLKPGTKVLVGHVPGPSGADNATFINIQP